MSTKQKNTTIKGTIAIGIAATLWGLDGVVLTPQLHNLDVGYVVFVLHLLPFLLMNLFFFKEIKKLTIMSKSDFFYFFLISLFGGALGTIAIVKSLFLVNFNHLSVVVLLQKLQPVFAILLARIILKERISKTFTLWAGVAITAGYLLAFGFHLPDTSGDGKELLYACLFALLAAFSFGSSTVFSKKILGNYSFVTSTYYRYGFTTVIMLIYMVLWGNFSEFSATTTNNWVFFIIIGLTTGAGAIFFYYYGLRNVKAIHSSIIELMFPISAVVFDYLIHGKIFTVIQWIAASIMFFAIIQLNRNRIQKQKT